MTRGMSNLAAKWTKFCTSRLIMLMQLLINGQINGTLIEEDFMHNLIVWGSTLLNFKVEKVKCIIAKIFGRFYTY